LVPLATGVFLSLILFSMAGGFLADRYSKRTVTIGVKVLEIAIMSSQRRPFSCGAFVGNRCDLSHGNIARFLDIEVWSPSRTSTGETALLGNGILELGTFLAIISVPPPAVSLRHV